MAISLASVYFAGTRKKMRWSSTDTGVSSLSLMCLGRKPYCRITVLSLWEPMYTSRASSLAARPLLGMMCVSRGLSRTELNAHDLLSSSTGNLVRLKNLSRFCWSSGAKLWLAGHQIYPAALGLPPSWGLACSEDSLATRMSSWALFYFSTAAWASGLSQFRARMTS